MTTIIFIEIKHKQDHNWMNTYHQIIFFLSPPIKQKVWKILLLLVIACFRLHSFLFFPLVLLFRSRERLSICIESIAALWKLSALSISLSTFSRSLVPLNESSSDVAVNALPILMSAGRSVRAALSYLDRLGDLERPRIWLDWTLAIVTKEKQKGN